MVACLAGCCACLAIASAHSQTAPSFWQRGQVRELFISGLPADDAALASWAKDGVNCVTGVAPELAHKHGLRTRTWFTMDYMDSRNMEEATIKAMAAVREDGSYLRPNDPLFPTVGQFGWSACVNNPQWVEHSQGIFRKMGQDGYDGCHIDFASHYEPCFCEHCKQAWLAWAGRHGLAGIDLIAASHAEDVRTRMLLREFRIECVMAFLRGLREAAREANPQFAIDGTWHQDSGSTYQWAYGDHFELMCIEGTTSGPFPPDGTQIPWLKVAHALSERANRRPVAMSVTYHLLPDEQGAIHHGRMAPDRVRVALAEIISQGGVSWLGLGGPKTGNLLKEHQDLVRAYYRQARDLAPILTGAQDVADVGLVFSAKSFLMTGAVRTQLFAIAQALMSAHVPFTVLSDAGLAPEKLSGLSGVVLLSAPALSDAGCNTLDAYVRGGGKLLVIGDDAATLTEDWRERTPRPEFAVPSAEGPRALGKGRCFYWLEAASSGQQLGASQGVALNQEQPIRLAIEGWSKAEAVSGGQDSGYSLYVDLVHQDGSPLWGQTAQFKPGTHDWEFARTIVESDRPFKSANIHALFRGHRGTVWFRDIRFGVWDEAKGEIAENLLAGKWSPYGAGFETENMLDMGLWLKMAQTKGLGIGSMSAPDSRDIATVVEAVKPLLPPEPTLTIEGDGADRVYADLVRNGNLVLLQLINYAAELHPELSEMAQQSSEHGLPSGPLTIRLRSPAGTRIDPSAVRAHAPEGPVEVKCTAEGRDLVLHLDPIGPYAELAIPLQ